MSKWRRTAIDFFPLIERQIAACKSKTDLWDLLREEFIDAARSGKSLTCECIVRYYRWCVDGERERLPNDVQTSAVLGFLEKLSRSDEFITFLVRWLSEKEVLDYAANIEYSSGKDSVEKIKRVFALLKSNRNKR